MAASHRSADIEQRNSLEIERLNQRGGRTLSIVDLVEAGTLSTEMAALCRTMVLAGSSWLTGAVPGGAGKTTVMATLLGFLPSGEPIVTVADPGVVGQAAGGRVPLPATMLAHEMGAGRWFGYVWGADAADFLRLTQRGFRCVSCLHADDARQTEDSLYPLGVTPADLAGIGLQIYIHVTGSRGRTVRRVRSLQCRLAGRLQTVFRWREDTDTFEPGVRRDELARLLAADMGVAAAAVESVLQESERAIDALRDAGVRRFGDVRRALLSAPGIPALRGTQ